MGKSLYITSSYSRIVARVLRLQERELPRLLAGTGLHSDVLMPGDESRLTGEQQIRILENARRMSGQDEIGLQIGRQLQPSSHGPIGYLALRSPDLITALKALGDFLPLRIGFVKLQLGFHEEYLECKGFITLDAGEMVTRMLKECFAMLLLAVIESLLGRELREGQLGFAFPAPAYADQYGSYLQTKIKFSEKYDYLRIPAELAFASNQHGDADAYALAQDMCRSMLLQVPSTQLSLGDRVRRLLLSQPPESVSENNIAGSLFISRRTLARRLAGEGTCYRQIRDEIYAELAARHLREGRLTVEAISTLLGYQDTSNFRRAFRRWYGMSPQDFREESSQRLEV